MPSHSGGPARPVAIALCLIASCAALAVVSAARAQAANYPVLLCAADNGSGSYRTATNTISANNPQGIFNFENHCGPAPDPAGNSAFLRIAENQAGGNAGVTAYGSISWSVPPRVAILTAGGYTREPNAFNAGWRGRFWAEGWDGSVNNILMQGTGVENKSLGGIGWTTTSTFAPHLWPFGGFGDYRRFVFELTCYRQAGCDRTNFNAVDANTLVLRLADRQDSQVSFAAGSALLDGAWVRGTQTVAWRSSEAGSGMRFERLRLDGSTLHTVDHRPHCDLGSSGARGEFARAFAPCPTGGPWDRAYALETAALSDGEHRVSVCTQDYAQAHGMDGTGSESCAQRTIRVDNHAPGAPAGLQVVSANPHRYLDRFGATFSLPPDPGSPIAKVHYVTIDATGKAVVPERALSATNPTAIAEVQGPATAGDYRLKVWLEDSVGLTGPPTTAPVPHDTTPPAAPQSLQVAAPQASRVAEGFDLRWRDILDDGSPIAAAHYQVLDGAGHLVVPTTTVRGEGIEAIAGIAAPRERGAYALRLWLSDAEGNVGAPVSAPLAYSCVRSEGSGTAPSLSTGLGAAQSGAEVVGQGEGSILTGRLAERGQGVAGAPVCVFARVVTEARPEFLGIAISHRTGGYVFEVPAGPSRELSVLYRAGHREVGAAALLQTVVRPVLKVRRRVVRRGGVARFAGRIPGPHNDHVVVVLQVRRGKGWLAFRRYRTRRGGRFALSYRFNRGGRPMRYLVRAQVRSQAGYPYLQGTSRPQRLVVLPKRRRGR